MDEAGFRGYLKKLGKDAQVIDGLVRQVKVFEERLASRGSLLTESCSEELLLTALAELDRNEPGSTRKVLRALALYFRFSGFDSLAAAASKRRAQALEKERKPFLLREFLGVHAGHVAALEAAGCKRADQLLAACRSAADRQALAARTGVPDDAILELVKLSDLSRLAGVKAIRARLYYDAGVDSVEKLAGSEPADLLRRTADFVQNSGFKGIPPLPMEVQHTIEAARQLPRVVDYDD